VFCFTKITIFKLLVNFIFAFIQTGFSSNDLNTNVITAAIPVYTQNTVKVAAIDFKASQLLGIPMSFQPNFYSYAFVMNDQGRLGYFLKNR